MGISICRKRSPGARRLRWLPVTKSMTRIFCSPPPAFQMVQTPSSAEVSEIIGPAGSDMQRLPPTVAVFQILKEAEEGAATLADQRSCEPVGRAGEAIELRDGAGRGNAEMALGDRQCGPFQIGEIDQPRQVRLWF